MAILAVVAIYLEPYRYIRFISFTEPFENFYGPGWQLSNALLSIGRGEWFGMGLGNGLQKNLYLPEPHTDFIFAVIVEEFGLIGGFSYYYFIFHTHFWSYQNINQIIRAWKVVSRVNSFWRRYFNCNPSNI
jgi:cell division protein FtsW (lipid II flippase)